MTSETFRVVRRRKSLFISIHSPSVRRYRGKKLSLQREPGRDETRCETKRTQRASSNLPPISSSDISETGRAVVGVEVRSDDVCGLEDGGIWDGDVSEMDLKRGKETEKRQMSSTRFGFNPMSLLDENAGNSPSWGRERA